MSTTGLMIAILVVWNIGLTLAILGAVSVLRNHRTAIEIVAEGKS